MCSGPYTLYTIEMPLLYSSKEASHGKKTYQLLNARFG